jgi:hypothetical protein
VVSSFQIIEKRKRKRRTARNKDAKLKLTEKQKRKQRTALNKDAKLKRIKRTKCTEYEAQTARSANTNVDAKSENSEKPESRSQKLEH